MSCCITCVPNSQTAIVEARQPRAVDVDRYLSSLVNGGYESMTHVMNL